MWLWPLWEKIRWQTALRSAWLYLADSPACPVGGLSRCLLNSCRMPPLLPSADPESLGKDLHNAWWDKRSSFWTRGWYEIRPLRFRDNIVSVTRGMSFKALIGEQGSRSFYEERDIKRISVHLWGLKENFCFWVYTFCCTHLAQQFTMFQMKSKLHLIDPKAYFICGDMHKC